MDVPDTVTPLAPSRPEPFFWWCSICQLQTPFGYDQLNQFYQHGWPVCCGETVLGCANESSVS